MESVVCLERNINPNIASFKDSDLHACVCLHKYRVDLGVYTLSERLPMALASYALSLSELGYTESMYAIATQEKLLDPSFHYGSRSFTVQDFKSTLIPEKLYEPEKAPQYLDAIFHLNGRECMMQEKQNDSGAMILTAFNPAYKQAAQTLFSQESEDVAFHSLYGRLIEEGFKLWRTFKRFANHVLLHVRKNEFDLVLVNDSGLAFINTFPCPDFDNLLYYFLYAMGKQKIDLGTVALYLSGDASERNLLPLLEQQVYTATYLPAPGQVRFPGQMPYDRFFSCL